jgi:GT2 family glycosyltransferase
MKQPAVYIMVLNWNGKQLTSACLDSLQKISYQNYKILVIDNGSTDDSVKYIKRYYQDVAILELEDNLGYANGCNAGFKSIMGKCDFVVFLNNDTIVDEQFLEPLVNPLIQNQQIVQTVPKIYYMDYPEKIWYAGGQVNLWFGVIRHLGIRKTDSPANSLVKTTEYATGCCFCVRTEDFKSIGMFDETFSMYAEDVDLSLRLRNTMRDVLFIPSSKVWHKISASLGGSFSIRKWKRKSSSKIKLIFKYIRWYQFPSAIISLFFISIIDLFLSIVLTKDKRNR